MKGKKIIFFLLQIFNLLREPEYIIIPVNKLYVARASKYCYYIVTISVSKVISESEKE